MVEVECLGNMLGVPLKFQEIATLFYQVNIGFYFPTECIRV